MGADERWDAEVARRLDAVGGPLGLRTGRMFGLPALYAGRRLVACAYADGVVVRLPGPRAEQMLASGGAAPFRPDGRPPITGWVLVAGGDVDDDELEQLVVEAVTFVSGGSDGPGPASAL